MKISIILIIILFNSLSIFSQQKKDTLKVLFVGNSYSYTENVPHIASIISDSLPIKLVCMKSVAGNATLTDHWKGTKNLVTKSLINIGAFDIVILQDHSMRPIEKGDSTLYYIKMLSDYIKSKGAKPYLFCTWARLRVPQWQSKLNEIYQKAARDNDIAFIPIGPAWNLSRKLRPDFMLFNDDETHPSYLGSFLNACVIASFINGRTPDRLPTDYWTMDFKGETVQLMTLDPLDVAYVLEITKQILNEYKVK